jgi:poly-gamma-glutamate capsule biosynthesis protein CapA/YwtB (metallophosphatase superfamily)
MSVSEPSEPVALRIFLCGDVMTGRGIDQILPAPGLPGLHEPFSLDAERYVEIAEKRHGPIPRRVSYEYVWGDALEEIAAPGIDARIINLETAITSSERYWLGKEIHYRMHPRNLGCLVAAKIDCCCLANNHVLDWGVEGLEETLRALDSAGIAHAGAGPDQKQAAAPAVLERSSKGRILVFAYGAMSSGIPRDWAATKQRPGVNLLPELSEKSAEHVLEEIATFRQPGDTVVASVHWGENWSYRIRQTESQFAERLMAGGIRILHGHSSHHVKTLETRNNGLVLYGCGDLLNDYEGITGYEAFRSDLSLLYFVDLVEGAVRGVRLVPMHMERFRLHRASAADARWLCDLLNRLGAPVELGEDHSLTLHAEAG